LFEKYLAQYRARYLTSKFSISLSESVERLHNLPLCEPAHLSDHPHEILQIGIKYRSRVSRHCQIHSYTLLVSAFVDRARKQTKIRG